MNILFFITHKTLGIDHLDCCFKSLSNQSYLGEPLFDKMIVYNTHKDEISNEMIFDYYDKYLLDRRFKELEFFKYDENTPKNLGADITTIRNYCLNNKNGVVAGINVDAGNIQYINIGVSGFNENDRILLLKSDCLLSKRYFDVLAAIPNDKQVYFAAPFICAKQRVSNDEIFEYLSREEVTFSDDITFFVEDQYQSNNNDFHNRDIDILSEQIKFTSCYVIRDFSCHYLSVGLFPYVNIEHKSWGGVNFSNLVPYFIPTTEAFVVHKYHGIISENRNTDREGPVKMWLES